MDGRGNIGVKEIYKWEGSTNKWNHEDDIINERTKHAVSAITVDDSILYFCFGKYIFEILSISTD